MIVIWFYKWWNQFSHCCNQDVGTTLGHVFLRGQTRFGWAQHDREDWMPLWSAHLQEVFGTVPFRSLHLWKQLECYSRASWRGVSWKNTKKAFGRWILPSTSHLLFFLGPNFLVGFLWLQALRCFFFSPKYCGSEAWWNMATCTALFMPCHAMSDNGEAWWKLMTRDDPSTKWHRPHPWSWTKEGSASTSPSLWRYLQLLGHPWPKLFVLRSILDMLVFPWKFCRITSRSLEPCPISELLSKGSRGYSATTSIIRLLHSLPTFLVCCHV